MINRANSLPLIYKESLFWEKIKRGRNKKNALVLFSDIDGTLCENGKCENIEILFDLLKKLDIPICYITGRTFGNALKKRIFLGADIYIGSTGTEIWVKGLDNYFCEDKEYSNLIGRNWAKSRIMVVIKEILAKFTNLKPQNNENFEIENGKPKIGLNFYGNKKELQKVKFILNKSIGRNSGVIVSGPDENKVYSLDIVPKFLNFTGKAMPIVYLKRIFGKFTSIVAGNGGNDLEMIFESSSYGIILTGGIEDMDLPNFIGAAQSHKRLIKYQFNNDWYKLYLLKKESSGALTIIKAISDNEFIPSLSPKIQNLMGNYSNKLIKE